VCGDDLSLSHNLFLSLSLGVPACVSGGGDALLAGADENSWKSRATAGAAWEGEGGSLNSTRWLTLTEFVKWIGKEGEVDIDEEGKWHVRCINSEPGGGA
jgi:hypothetical protein